MNDQYHEELYGKTILITGGTGSFGYQMVKKLLKYPIFKLRIFSRDEDKHRQMQNEFIKSHPDHYHKLEFVLGDVRDKSRLIDALYDVEIIYHASALKQVPQVEFAPMEAYKTNTVGTQNLVDCVKESQREIKAILISTDKAVYPVSTMGLSKAMAEKIFISQIYDQINGSSFNCVRYGNVLGSRGSILPIWDEKIKNKEPIPITSEKMKRFFLTLEEATDLVLEATVGTKKYNTGNIYVKKAPACRIIDFAKAYAEIITGNDDYPLSFIGVRAGEKLDETLVSKEEMNHTIETDTHFIISKITENNFVSINEEYSTSTTQQLSHEQITAKLKEINWSK